MPIGMRYILISSVALSFLASLPLQAASSVSLFPRIKTKAEFVSPVFDQKAVDISKKWSAAMEREKSFFASYSEKYADRSQNPSAALPWHEKMDVSSQDYSYMVEKLKKPNLQKIFDAEIDVEKKGAKLIITTSYAGLKNPSIVFDTANEQISIGRVNYGKPTYNEGRSHLELIGRYVPGFEWRLTKDNATEGYIHIGRMPELGQCLLNLLVISGPPTPIMGSFLYKC